MRLAPRCSGTRKDGQPCGFAARRETGLCINHDPSYIERQRENRERGLRNSANNRRAMPIRLDEFDLSERASVQALVDAVMRLELTGRLSDARSRRLIRLLSIAVRNFDPPGWVPYRGRVAQHDFQRYNDVRACLLPKLEQLCLLADERDAARQEAQ